MTTITIDITERDDKRVNIRYQTGAKGTARKTECEVACAMVEMLKKEMLRRTGRRPDCETGTTAKADGKSIEVIENELR